MRVCEARLIVALSIISNGILLVVSVILMFGPSALFPYYTTTELDDTSNNDYIQGRHDKLVDTPLFILTGGVLLSQVVAIFCLSWPMMRDTLAASTTIDDDPASKGTVMIQPLTISLMRLGSLMSGMTGIAMTLAGSMLVVWDGNKGDDSTPLIILGFFVVVCAMVAGLLTLATHNTDDDASVDANRSVSMRKLSASVTTMTWREVSGEYGTPQSRPRDTREQRSLTETRDASVREDASPIIPRPESMSAIKVNLIASKDGPKNVPLPKSFHAILPMTVPIQPPLPSLPMPPPPPTNDTWENGYTELIKFHHQHGHCKVLHGRLAAWLDKQRRDYQTLVHQFTRPIDCQLNSDRIDLLNALSVDWSYNEAEEWTERYGQLKCHYERYGSIGMSSSTDRSPRSSRAAEYPVVCEELKEWMRQQQEEYKLWKIKAPTTMTIERILKLQALKFVWEDAAAVGRVPSEIVVDDAADVISVLV